MHRGIIPELQEGRAGAEAGCSNKGLLPRRAGMPGLRSFYAISKEAPRRAAVTPQPGPAPKKSKVFENIQKTKKSQESEKEVKEPGKDEGVGDKVTTLEKKIKSSKKVIEMDDRLLEATLEDGRRITAKMMKQWEEMYERNDLSQREPADGREGWTHGETG